MYESILDRNQLSHVKHVVISMNVKDVCVIKELI